MVLPERTVSRTEYSAYARKFGQFGKCIDLIHITTVMRRHPPTCHLDTNYRIQDTKLNVPHVIDIV